MGILLTLFYVVAAFITPAVLFGPLAEYHLQLGMAILTLVASVFAAEDSEILSMPQTYAVVALVGAVAMSMLMTGWLSGTVMVLMDFLPTSIVFFFVVLNFRTRFHFQLLTAALFLVAAWVIYQGWHAENILDDASPFLLSMKNSDDEFFFRVRGLGFLNDPNDFSQFLVGLVPCMFFFWRKGGAFRNLLLVYVPVAILLFGMFETHSRGGMIALLVMVIVLSHRKLGKVWSIVAGGLLFVAISALGWSGGRDVSAEAGSDRTDAWSAGLELIRSHPIFGVGFNQFAEHYPITAHNTVVVCAAEIGLVGLFFWMLLIVPTIRDVRAAAVPPDLNKKRKDRDENAFEDPLGQRAGMQLEPALSGVSTSAALKSSSSMFAYNDGGYGMTDAQGVSESLEARAPEARATGARAAFDPFEPDEEQALPESEVRRLGRVVMLSLTGFLTAGWFLSRAYTMVLFIYMGLGVAVYRLAFQSGYAPPPLAMGKACKRAGIASFLMIVVVYVILRINNLILR